MLYPKRRIPLTHAFNVRDIGGHPAAFGKATRWHTLYRADGLATLDDTDWQTLFAHGIRTVVDLRSDSETKALPDRVPAGVAYRHCPLKRASSEAQDAQTAAHDAFLDSLQEGYRRIVLEVPDLLAYALQTIIDGLQDGAVLFHCAAGKDRTGVVAAALLVLLGVGDEDIIADYEVSFVHNTHGINAFATQNMDFEKAARAYGVPISVVEDKFLDMLDSSPDNMRALLACIATLDFPAYLTAKGLRAGAVEALRAHALV